MLAVGLPTTCNNLHVLCRDLVSIQITVKYSSSVVGIVLASVNVFVIMPWTQRKSLMCRKCEGHEDAVRVLAVAAGKVFSGSYDGTIGVW